MWGGLCCWLICLLYLLEWVRGVLISFWFCIWLLWIFNWFGFVTFVLLMIVVWLADWLFCLFCVLIVIVFYWLVVCDFIFISLLDLLGVRCLLFCCKFVVRWFW